jgi:hypothetical protein
LNWLDILERRGRQAVQPEPRKPTSISAAPQRLPKPEIKHVWFTTRRPQGRDDLGATEAGYYSVADSVLTMHEEDGRPTGKEYRLAAGDDARMIACRLAKEAWMKGRGENDFNRPLGYARLGIC